MEGLAARATLRRRERLREAPIFQQLFRGASRLERESFVLLWTAAAGRRSAGFAAGRRLGGSVVRNQARRRLREAYRRHKHLVAAEGIRLCFVARRRAVEAPFAALMQDVAGALRAAGRRSAG